MLAVETIAFLLIDDAELLRMIGINLYCFGLFDLNVFFGFSCTLMLVTVKVSTLEGKVFPGLLDLNSLCQGFKTHLKTRPNAAYDHAENISFIAVARALNFLA